MTNEGLAKWKKTIDAGAGLDMFEEMVQNVMDADDNIPLATRATAPKPKSVATMPQPASSPPQKKSSSDDDDFDAMVQDVLDEPMDKEKPFTKVHITGTAKPTAESPAAPVQAASVQTAPVQSAPIASTASVITPRDDSAAAIDWTPEEATAEPNALSPDESKSSRLLFSLIGHVLAALIGLGLGYLILNWMRPEKFPLPW